MQDKLYLYCGLLTEWLKPQTSLFQSTFHRKRSDEDVQHDFERNRQGRFSQSNF